MSSQTKHWASRPLARTVETCSVRLSRVSRWVRAQSIALQSRFIVCPVLYQEKKEMEHLTGHYSVDGTLSFERLASDKLHERMGGSLQIVGAIREHGIVALGLETTTQPLNPFVFEDGCSEREVRGDILLVATDEDGNPCDVDVEDIVAIINR